MKSVSKWVCMQCAKVNLIEGLRCERCQLPNPYLPTQSSSGQEKRVPGHSILKLLQPHNWAK